MLRQSMKSKLILALVVVSLLLSPILTVTAVPLPSEVWVDDDFDLSTDGYGYTHFSSIQEGVGSVAADGIVHVAPGIYQYFQVYTPGVSVLAEEGAVVDGDLIPSDLSASGISGGIIVSADNVTIQGFTVQNFYTGIYVSGSMVLFGEPIEPMLDPEPQIPFNALIQGNTLIGNGYGIEAYGVGNAFKENTITETEWHSMDINGSGVIIADNRIDQAGQVAIIFNGNSFTIYDNTTTNAVAGIVGDGVMNSILYNNTSNNNDAGLVILGGGNDIFDNIFTDNNVVGIEAINVDMIRLRASIEPEPGDIPNEFTNNLITGNGGAYYPDAAVQSSTPVGILQFENGGGIFSTSHNIFRGNHIADNEGFGLYYETVMFNSKTEEPVVENVDAMLNWWGHTSGPYHPCSNPDASGQLVSDNVDYSPWLLAEPNAPAPVTTRTDALTEGDSIGIDNVISAVVTSGEGTVTVGEYSENPTDESLFGSAGSYADVYVTSPHNIEELVVYLYYEGNPENEKELVLHWWNGSEWIACSDSGVDMENKYVWAVITEDSIPTFSDLSGTEIGAGLIEPEGEEEPEDKEELPDTGGLGITVYGFVFMAAGFYLSRKKEV